MWNIYFMDLLLHNKNIFHTMSVISGLCFLVAYVICGATKIVTPKCPSVQVLASSTKILGTTFALFFILLIMTPSPQSLKLLVAMEISKNGENKEILESYLKYKFVENEE